MSGSASYYLKRAISEAGGRLLGSAQSAVNQPVFIIGPPRSGTTLFEQAYLSEFCPAYISNLTVRWRHAPFFASRITASFSWLRRESFESIYGATTGVFSPHEGWPIWNRWFPTGDAGDYLAAGNLDDATCERVREFVRRMSQLFRAHFVMKNVKNSVRICALTEIFPECCFIVMRRNPVNNAESILTGWHKYIKTPRKWHSTRMPPLPLPLRYRYVGGHA